MEWHNAELMHQAIHSREECGLLSLQGLSNQGFLFVPQCTGSEIQTLVVF